MCIWVGEEKTLPSLRFLIWFTRHFLEDDDGEVKVAQGQTYNTNVELRKILNWDSAAIQQIEDLRSSNVSGYNIQTLNYEEIIAEILNEEGWPEGVGNEEEPQQQVN